MKLDLEQIQALMTALKESGLSKLKIKQGDEELVLEHQAKAPPAPRAGPPEPPLPAAPHEPKPELDGQFATCPIVGTFYRSPSPETNAFVEVGDTVTEDTVVCIVEAMKVMNEVKAGVSGVVKEVLVDNGHPVEFGTKLFRIG